jgi:hypothetical protein
VYLFENVSSCEHGNGPPGSVNGPEFVDQMSDCQLLMNLLYGLVQIDKFVSQDGDALYRGGPSYIGACVRA